MWILNTSGTIDPSGWKSLEVGGIEVEGERLEDKACKGNRHAGHPYIPPPVLVGIESHDEIDEQGKGGNDFEQGHPASAVVNERHHMEGPPAAWRPAENHIDKEDGIVGHQSEETPIQQPLIPSRILRFQHAAKLIRDEGRHPQKGP